MNPTELKNDLDKCVSHLKEELAQIRTGRATPELVEPIKVEAYGTMNPLKNLGNISASDAKSLVVQLWDPSIKEDVVKAIRDAELGLSPVLEGDSVRIGLPDLTEERRKDLVKIMKDRVETARIAVRNVRRDYIKLIDGLEADGLREDDAKRQKEDVEKEVKTVNEEIEKLREAKENDIMTV